MGAFLCILLFVYWMSFLGPNLAKSSQRSRRKNGANANRIKGKQRGHIFFRHLEGGCSIQLSYERKPVQPPRRTMTAPRLRASSSASTADATSPDSRDRRASDTRDAHDPFPPATGDQRTG